MVPQAVGRHVFGAYAPVPAWSGACLWRRQPAVSLQGICRQTWWKRGMPVVLSAPPPANSITAGSLPPNLTDTTANGVVYSAAGYQHPIRKPITKLDRKGAANGAVCAVADKQHLCRDPATKLDCEEPPKGLSALQLASSIPKMSPPQNLMGRATNGVIYAAAERAASCQGTPHQTSWPGPPTVLSVPLPASRIPPGTQLSTLMARAANGSVCAVVAQQPPLREPDT